jgi:hypothetical protein
VDGGEKAVPEEAVVTDIRNGEPDFFERDTGRRGEVRGEAKLSNILGI